MTTNKKTSCLRVTSKDYAISYFHFQRGEKYETFTVIAYYHRRNRRNMDIYFLLFVGQDIQKVSFTNRYGIKLVGDLYIPKNKTAEKLPAIAVSGPFGAVKEQSSGLYAQTMAERGFITLTRPIPGKAAANPALWPLLTLTPKISLLPLTF